MLHNSVFKFGSDIIFVKRDVISKCSNLAVKEKWFVMHDELVNVYKCNI